jgi:uncharacterized protein YecE (DUF72 family)
MSFRVGTSGWYYDEWIGPFYEKKKGMLTAYTKIFDTSEVNSTFYRFPTPKMVEGWYRNAPPGFLYALKLPGVITHDKWLNLDRGVEDDTKRFLNLVRPLAEKLGPILIQLRPKFNYSDNSEDLERFLESLPKNYEWAVEFRHLSWMNEETCKILEKYNTAYTIVDEPLLPPETWITAEFAYIRWHGHGTNPWYNYDYTVSELESWVPKVIETTRKAKKTYGYFNNHFSANAVKNAVEILEMLNKATPSQKGALDKILEYRSKETSKPQSMSLTAYVSQQDEGLSVADLILRFTNTSRLTRAEQIGDNELKIIDNSEDKIEAGIRNYSIEIDRNSKTMTHDCDDWRKGAVRKRMCKHIAKLFLSLPEGQSQEILVNIWENQEAWKFDSS